MTKVISFSCSSVFILSSSVCRHELEPPAALVAIFYPNSLQFFVHFRELCSIVQELDSGHRITPAQGSISVTTLVREIIPLLSKQQKPLILGWTPNHTDKKTFMSSIVVSIVENMGKKLRNILIHFSMYLYRIHFISIFVYSFFLKQ